VNGLQLHAVSERDVDLPQRADIHRLYDAGYVTVTPDYRFRVSHDLADNFHNGREYERFAGRAITVPRASIDQPSPELLDWHAAEVFRG
jgi:putative restriction endonuclease